MFLNSTKLLFANTMIVGVMVSICSNNWFMIWSGMEISLMSLIPLMSGYNMITSECMMKYFIVQGASSSILILGLILMLIHVSFNEKIILVSLLMKLGMAPFHNWVLVIVEGLSYSVTFMVLTIIKIPPLVFMSYMHVDSKIPVMMSLIVGSLFSLNQSSIRKILAYSSIFNLSFLAISCMEISVWTLYFTIYSFILLNLMICMYKLNVNYINQIIVNENNFETKISMWVLILSLGGMPPLLGFLSKLMVFEMLMSKNEMLVLIIMIISSLLVMFYYMRMMYLSLLFSCITLTWNKLNLINISLTFCFMNILLTPMIIMIKSLT